MDINIGDKFLVAAFGREPFLWNFECDESVIEVNVADPELELTGRDEKEGVFWINPYYGKLVLVETSYYQRQWVPVGELRPIVNNKHKYKVGYRVVVKNNNPYLGSEEGHVGFPGTVAYVTDVLEHGCQLALDPDCHPDEHSKRSLFFRNEWFEPYEG